MAVAAALLAIGVLSVAAAEDVCGEFARIEALADEASARGAVRAAVSRDLLVQVARKSKSWRLRADAAYFISDEKVLREIFANDSAWQVKSAALFGMVDGDFLKRVACDEKVDGRVRAVAVHKLRDRAVLEKLKSSPNETVRRFAAKQLPPEVKEATVKDAEIKEPNVVPMPLASFTDVESITRKSK